MQKIDTQKLKKHLQVAKGVYQLVSNLQGQYADRYPSWAGEIELAQLIEVDELLASLDSTPGTTNNPTGNSMNMSELHFLSEISSGQTNVAFRYYEEVPDFVYNDLVQPSDGLEGAASVEKLQLDIENIEFRVRQLEEKLESQNNTREEAQDLEDRLRRNRNLLRIKRSQLQLVKIWLIDYVREQKQLANKAY